MSGTRRAEIHVGRMIYASREEAQELWELAEQMKVASWHRRKGWLRDYIRAHTKASRIITELVKRSHSSS